jgi:hypothetical protein
VTEILSLPATSGAIARWKDITGLTTSSPEWGEAMRAAQHCGLLSPLGSPRGVIRAGLALVVGAHLVRRCRKIDLSYANGLEIALLFLDRCHRELSTLSFDHAEDRLTVLADERLLQVVGTPAHGLSYLLTLYGQWPESLHPLAELILSKAIASDEVALDVFRGLVGISGPEYQVELAPLSDGRYVVFRRNTEEGSLLGAGR